MSINLLLQILFQLHVELQKIVYTNRTEGILIDFSGLKLKRFNRTTYTINGEFEVLQDIGNDAMVRKLNSVVNYQENFRLLLRSQSISTKCKVGLETFEYDEEPTLNLFILGNEYRKTPYHIAATPFCKFARDENMPYMELVEHSDLPPADTCPLPAVCHQ
jgi:hypothetical protein